MMNGIELYALMFRMMLFLRGIQGYAILCNAAKKPEWSAAQ